MSQEYITNPKDMLSLPDGTYRARVNYFWNCNKDTAGWCLVEKVLNTFVDAEHNTVREGKELQLVDPKPFDLSVDYIAQLQHKDKQIADAKYHGVLAALTALVQEVQKPESKGVITEHTLVALLNKQLEKESHHGKAG